MQKINKHHFHLAFEIFLLFYVKSIILLNLILFLVAKIIDIYP